MSLLRRLRRQDDGFGLVEAVVAIFIALVVLTALGSLLTAGVKASLLARQNQQAGDLLDKQIESLRALPFASITMNSNDATLNTSSDQNITTSAGVMYYNPGTGSEPLAVAGVGASQLNPHTQTITVNGTPYTVNTYITCPPDSPSCITTTGVKYRRATVTVTWTSKGVSHTRRESTMLVNTRRGLPLPYFKFGKTQTISTNVGAQIQLPFFVTNLGARDAWDLTITPGSWTWWYDANSNGALDSGDVQMTGSPSYTDPSGNVETGVIESGVTMGLFAVRTATSADVGVTTVTASATSIAQPTASSASQSVTDTVQTASTPCAGCTNTSVYLHNYTAANQGASGDTSAVKAMAMDFNAPTNATLSNYSTDVNPSGLGRTVTSGGSGTSETNTSKVAAWQRQMSNTCTLPSGSTVTVNFWAAPMSGTTGAVTVFVGSDTKGQINNFQSAGSTTYAPSSWVSGWQQVSVSVPVASTFSIQNNKDVEIRVEVPSSSGSIQLAYDTTAYPASVMLPMSGTGCL